MVLFSHWERTAFEKGKILQRSGNIACRKKGKKVQPRRLANWPVPKDAEPRVLAEWDLEIEDEEEEDELEEEFNLV